MSEPVVLDVREVAPRERHGQIFRTLDELEPGQSLLLVNDHDPRPLFYQLQAERQGEVEWLPQEEGPERWVIRIEKRAAREVDSLVTLDVRPDIRSGREPFGKIMDTVKALRPGQSLALINDFEPAPLYGILESRGFGHRTERTPDGAWRILFSPVPRTE